MSSFDTKTFKNKSVPDENVNSDLVTFADDVGRKISEAVHSHSGVCVTPIRTRVFPTKEVAVITVDKNKIKAVKIQTPSNELLCRFRDIQVIEDGSWTPYFNTQLLGNDDYTKLRNSILDISVTRFDSTDTKFYIFGTDYVNINLPNEVVLTYTDEENAKTGNVKGLVDQDENEHYLVKVSTKSNEGVNMNELNLPTFKLIIPL
jgi:pantothenate kinase